MNRHEMNGSPGREALASQAPQPHQPLRGLRIPTVSEALPFSPFSSIVPFNPDIIPPPLNLVPPTITSFPPTKDVIHAREVLDRLCAGAKRAKHASERCKQTLQDVRKLLDPDSLTQYSFRKPGPGSRGTAVPSQPDMHNIALGPFARMVYDNAAVEYIYNAATPEQRPVKQEQNGGAHSHPAPQARVVVEIPVQQMKAQTPGPQQSDQSPNGRFAVVIPQTMTSEERAQYQYIDVPDEQTIAVHQPPQTQSKAAANGTPSRVNGELKHRNDAAVQHLQNLLYDIFEAEDGLQADTSGNISRSNTIFASRDTETGSVPVLRNDYQLKLDSTVQKVVSAGRIEGIEIEHLARVQRICEVAVVAVDSSNLHIGEDWSEQDVEDWQYRIASAERGLCAARSLLRIMSAGTHIKELQSEDYLGEVVSALRTVIENFFVPLVEERALAWEKNRGEKDEPPANPKFGVAIEHRKHLQTLLQAATKALRTLGTFLSKNDVEESTLSSVQYFCKLLIFAENAAAERDSVVGIQNFETTRKCAMDVIAAIYVRYIDQRQFIVDEILTSLEKLPATKQSARQFRLNDCKPIQLVSALLMRLVQTSATFGEDAARIRSRTTKDAVHSNESSGESEEESEDEGMSEDEDDRKKAAPSGLSAVSEPLHAAAQTNASYIIKFLIQRALTTSKSSDEPFRRLLDIFTQDFLEVLGSSDWPSAELLLRTLVLHLIVLAENPKQSAAARVMALELLGTIGSGILQLQKIARSAVRGLDTADSVVAVKLSNIVAQSESASLELDALCDFDGPYRMVVEYLQARDEEDPQLKSAQGFHLMQWATLVVEARDSKFDSKVVQKNLRSMILNPHWLQEHYDYPSLETKEGRLASVAVMLNSNLFKAFPRIFRVLLNSMSVEQPTIRSRSLKSVSALLETDPSMLDRKEVILKYIANSASDKHSSMVRSSAIGLLEKCTSLRPTLDPQVYKTIITRTEDAVPSVRKAALNLLTKFYRRNDNEEMHAKIAGAIIARIYDIEDPIKDLARNTMEQIWFQPLYSLKLEGDRAAEAKIRFNAQAALFVNTVRSGIDVPKVLEALVMELLTKSKAAQLNSQVCKTLIQLLFDGVIDNSDLPGKPTQHDILLCLTVFARACPKLFAARQLERLEPYTQNLTNQDDLDVYRSAISILQHTLPFQTALGATFLTSLRSALLNSVQRLQSAELAVAVSCLWTVARMQSNMAPLVNLLKSALAKIAELRQADFRGEPGKASRLTRLMRIASHVAAACDLDSDLNAFRTQIPSFKGTSVSDLVAELFCPFTVPKQPLEIREASLDGLCIVAQEWPRLYLRADVVNAFETVFADRISSLEQILLSGLEAFYCQEDVLKGAENVPELGTGVASGTERLGRTYVATDRDGASTSIAQRFLDDIRRLALSSCDETSFIAARVVISINKHSLVMPKLSAPALVALETCPNPIIANLAFSEHKEQHAKRESLFEKEYMRAIDQAFQYQAEVIHHPQGYNGDAPPVSKMYLLWEVLKTGKAQVRKKFLGNVSQKLDFDAHTHASVHHAALVRFCCENLAFFDYDKMDDILHLLIALGKTFSGTGTAVAQAIESEVLRLRVDTVPGSQQNENAMSEETSPVLAPPPISQERLRQLASSAQALSIIWATRAFVMRVWNMQRHVEKAKHTDKNKAPKEKDLNRAPIKSAQAQSLTQDYLARIHELVASVSTVQGQHRLCSTFIDTISVDTEVTTTSDGEEDGLLEDAVGTPSEGTTSRSASEAPGSGSRKRKSSVSGGPMRKRNRPSGSRNKKSLSANMGDEDDSEGGWA